MTAAATATVDLVDAKDEAVKAELRLDIAQAVSEVVMAIERRSTNLERRLAIATYWLFGVTAAGHAATISIVISLAD